MKVPMNRLLTPKQTIHQVACRATVEPAHEQPTQVELAAFKLAYEEAGLPLITDGKPTVMRLTAWMCHEGTNRNRLAFVGAELEAAAAKITLPDAIVMDFNHSAIHGYGDEQRCIGMWYAGEYAFDAKANDGAGAWGILVQGVMFAWLFPDIANALHAEQARNGSINFSMACIAGTTEYAYDAAGQFYSIAHNPVFFTNSALDVKPADPDAKGLGSEATGPEVEAEQRAKLLEPNVAMAAAALEQENTMTKAELTALLAQLGGDFSEQLTQVFATRDTAELTLQTQVAELETQLAERETALSAAQETATQHEAALEAANEALGVAQAQLAAAAVERATTELEATKAARVAALPEAVRLAHAKRDDAKRARLETKWAAMSEADFTVYLEDELGIVPLTAAFGTSYLDRSNAEGFIPTAAPDAANTLGARARAHIK